MLKSAYIVALATGVILIFASLLSGPALQMPLLLTGCSMLYFLLTFKDKILPETKEFIRNPRGLFFVLSVLLCLSYLFFGAEGWMVKILVGLLMLVILIHRYLVKPPEDK
ncbi:MAG: hypothetical protein ACRC9Q_05030 [Bacteroidales bacterium]